MSAESTPALPSEITEAIAAYADAAYAYGCLDGAPDDAEKKDARTHVRECRAALDEVIGRYVEDAERIEWIIDNATSVSDGYGPDGQLMDLGHSTHVRVLLLEVRLPTVPRETQDCTRAAIDAARSTPRPPSR